MNSSTNLPLISVVIPNHNGAKFLANCLRSLQSQTYQKMEITVVDNASGDQSLEIVHAAAPRAVLVRNDRNLGFAGAVNNGVLASHGDWVAVLNNDTELPPRLVGGSVRWQSKIAGCHLLCMQDSRFCGTQPALQRGRLFFARRGSGIDVARNCRIGRISTKSAGFFSASGCAALYRRQTLQEMGGFDRRFFAYLEDVDLRLRLRRLAAMAIMPHAPRSSITAGEPVEESSPPWRSARAPGILCCFCSRACPEKS